MNEYDFKFSRNHADTKVFTVLNMSHLIRENRGGDWGGFPKFVPFLF